MRRVILFVLILVITGGITHSATYTLFAGVGIFMLVVFAILIGGIIDGLIYLAGGKPALADKVLTAILGEDFLEPKNTTPPKGGWKKTPENWKSDN